MIWSSAGDGEYYNTCNLYIFVIITQFNIRALIGL